ncbi:MFS transporter [Microbacterium trichothecenolyticum]|uniref:DHA1 family inner membrane transport protein n=1 Tax=Microbacterium trichothecenolyticum TaxID=69370 RepID=A0ABU0TZU9_MICTR|nr:MFS transporter [Microbacterium trichothecenolyticum]MDQ1124444.1 DHA1 family inner membrane transport protein [Microbacterium trichothecenolyticum]
MTDQTNDHGAGVTGVGRLRMIGMLSFFDRFATAPLLVLVVRDLGVPLSAAVQLVTVYALTYAFGQPLWGLVSDRTGRKPVLLLALAGMAVGSVASTLTPDLSSLLIVRAVTGLFVGALFPTVLTLLGDRYSGPERTRQISSLQSFTAIGTTAATLTAGVIGVVAGWRTLFLIAGMGAVALFLFAGRITEPSRGVAPRAIRVSFGRWPVALYLVGIVEGGVLLGIFSYIVPALEQAGVGVALAGVLASAYGVGIIVGAMTSRRVSARVSRTWSITIGSGLLVAAYLLAAASPTSIGLTLAAALLGLCNSLLHASLQGIATELTPTSRATTVSLFVCSVFIGSALAVAVTAQQASGSYPTVFVESAGAGVIMAIAAVAISRGWTSRHQSEVR